MRDMDRKKELNAQYHKERMATDLDYRMRKLLATMRARCYSGKGRNDWEWYGAKGLEVTITVEQMKTLWIRDGADKQIRPSIDRIDRNLGYTFENCQFIEIADNLRRTVPTRRPRGKDRRPRYRRVIT